MSYSDHLYHRLTIEDIIVSHSVCSVLGLSMICRDPTISKS